MGKAALGLFLLAIVGGAVAYSAGVIKFGAGAMAGTCQEDAEIAQARRDALEDRAMAFVQAGLQQDTGKAYDMMTKEAQKSVTLANLGTMFDFLHKTAAPFEDPRVLHTYFLQTAGGGPNSRAICGTLANNGWVSVEIKPGVDQGHVLISAKARNNDWAFTLWMLPDGNGWQVEYFHANPSSVVGLTPEVLLQRARGERDSGHAFNAAMLYAGAQGIADFGSAFQLAITQPLREDLVKFQLPSELAGNPPFIWNMQGRKFTVQRAGIIGIAGQVGVMFLLPQATWSGNDEAEKFNREFINAFIAAHPDYTRSFSFLVARALKPDNSGGFGTVYQNGKGFD